MPRSAPDASAMARDIRLANQRVMRESIIAQNRFQQLTHEWANIPLPEDMDVDL